MISVATNVAKITPKIAKAISWTVPTLIGYGTDYFMNDSDIDETSQNLISTGAGAGGQILANKLATNKFLPTSKFGKITQAALVSTPLLFGLFSTEEKPSTETTNKDVITDSLAKANPTKPKEDIATEIDLLDQMAKKTKSDYEKAMAPINALASGYTDPMNPKGIDFSRVEKSVKALGDAALSYSAGKALGALYVQAGLQGALDMVDKNSLLSADTFNKMKQMTSAMISAKKGNREAAGTLRQIMGDLEAIGLKNKDVISAVGMAADMNVKLANQLNDLAIAKQKVQSKTVTLDGKGKAPNLSYLNMVQDNLIAKKKDALELGDQKAAKIAQDKLDQLSNYISSNYPGLQLSSGSSSGKKISMADL
jgi:hypothetical protein